MRAILILLLSMQILFSAVGKITYVGNEAYIKRGGQQIKAQVGAQIEQKDEIETKKDSKITMVLEDETVIAFGQNSLFSIDSYMFDENSKNNESKFTSKGGVLRVVSGKMGKINPEKFQIKTYTATMGIRGTEFAGAVTRNADAWFCSSGEIYVTAGGQTVNVPAGSMTSVRANQKPEAPKKYPQSQFDNLTNLTKASADLYCPME